MDTSITKVFGLLFRSKLCKKRTRCEAAFAETRVLFATLSYLIYTFTSVENMQNYKLCTMHACIISHKNFYTSLKYVLKAQTFFASELNLGKNAKSKCLFGNSSFKLTHCSSKEVQPHHNIVISLRITRTFNQVHRARCQ